MEDVSKRVENHDWEHGENWKSIKRQAHQIFHTHQAVTMIAKLLLKRAPDVDRKKVEQIEQKLIEAMGKTD